jgi:glycosyltransferase involved in cell wall biosynthesis
MIRPFLEGGGATKSLLNLSEGLVEKGHQVTIATAGGLWLPKARKAQLPIIQVPLAPSTPLHLILAARKIRKIIRQRQINLIHSHHRFASLTAAFASRGLNIPHIATVHEYKFNLPRLTRLAMGGEIITFSKALGQHLINHYHIPAHKINVVTMGVGQFGSSPNSNLAMKRPSILCIARLSTEKGVSILLQAMAQLLNTTAHKPHCYIVGDGPLLNQLKSEVNELRINNFVTFLGWQDNMAGLISQCECLALPSLLEGFGLVVLEGWACDRPTIGSQVGGISELIQDGKNGLLVPPNNVTALADAIQHLLAHPTLAQRMGRHGRSEMLPRFTIEAMVNETERIYDKVSER